jgi:fumarate hydratase subunit beta
MEYHMATPVSEEEARRLRVGDTLYLSGVVFTARDEAHKRALEYVREGKVFPISAEGLAMFHCGPIAQRIDLGWRIVSAGPTTSTRMEMFEADFLDRFKVRVIIGKGGMGKRTTEAMARVGAVYCAFTGGAGALGAEAVQSVKGVEWLDLGMPEALWILEVKAFGPLTVAIDAHGNNLYEEVTRRVEENLKRIYARL